MAGGTKKSDFKADFLRRLHDPTQLRWIITATVLLLGGGAVYLPLSSQVEEAARKCTTEKTRLALARDVETLRAEFQKVQQRLPKKSDPNEWVQYVLGGIRLYPVKLMSLDSDQPKSVGPYKIIVLRVVLEGTFKDLDGFLRWLDTNERLLRVDVVKLEPQAKGEALVLQLTVLEVMG